MHAALGVGFLCKSAVAWMVPCMALVTLVIWEKRWRELWRWELYLGLLVQAAMIFTWIWFVYVGEDGPAHLKVFFWNNLVGKFPPEYSLGITVALIAAGIVYSLWKTRNDAPSAS